ncbi:hypothetical protein NXX22_26625 [Bacteroides thetaiotaomicron]|nr:hypothetical protein [Bacteroides thetaiotaomicron]
MLSRAMLYAERWDDARIAAEEVMGMGYNWKKKRIILMHLKQEVRKLFCNIAMTKSSTVTHDFDGYMAPGGDKALDGNS